MVPGTEAEHDGAGGLPGIETVEHPQGLFPRLVQAAESSPVRHSEGVGSIRRSTVLDRTGLDDLQSTPHPLTGRTEARQVPREDVVTPEDSRGRCGLVVVRVMVDHVEGCLRILRGRDPCRMPLLLRSTNRDFRLT